MECNPKNRGRKHVLNKAKYNKNKPKATLPKANIKSKSLQSNWDRYGDELDDDYVPLGSDFSLLANAPLSKGNHFQFKAEAHKIQDIETTSIDTSGLFNIDLNSIGLSLSTIPFNIRCGIPDHYYSVSQRNIMMQTAKNNEKIYEQSLANQSNNSVSSINRYFSSKDSISPMSFSNNDLKHNKMKLENDERPSSPKEGIIKMSSISIKTDKGPLFDICNFTRNKQDSPLECSSSILETESLQQWLDDVLED